MSTHLKAILGVERPDLEHGVYVFSSSYPKRSYQTTRLSTLFIGVVTLIVSISACFYFHTFNSLFFYLSLLLVALPLMLLEDVVTYLRARALPWKLRNWFTLAVEFTLLTTLATAMLGPIDITEMTPSSSTHLKRSNLTVFIASNLYNSEEVLPSYTSSLLTLIDHLGRENVYVSIYESHSKDRTRHLLQSLDAELHSRGVARAIVMDDAGSHIGLGPEKNGRIEFLSAVRNRALEPLTDNFTHVLWLNDILFDPSAAFELLHSYSGEYDQVCALDFVGNGFYDTWVLRDIEDGTAKRPWPYLGRPQDIQALRAGRPFPVNSCWNGMTAFDARWFTQHHLRFRSEPECFSSECQLISYDIHRLTSPLRPRIFVNPRVQVAYEKRIFSLYNSIIPAKLVAPWRTFWRGGLSYWVMDWLSESQRRSNPCRAVLNRWADPDAPMYSVP